MGEFTILQAGTVVAGRFEIRKVLGTGGMGAVYEAFDSLAGANVALKTLHEALYGRDDLVKRFEREARAAARIGHPNIVGILSLGHDEARRTRFMVQECLQGTDVSRCLNEFGSFSPQTALAVTLPLMDALAAAHAVGIVHRDIKPDNIFLHEAADGTIVPKVIDFGIAKVIDELDRMERTATGMVFGTPWYMSPEQALGESSIDARTDVWSVGAMLYEMLCGTLPFGGADANAVMAQIIFGEPTPLCHHLPNVPEDLAAVVHRSIERDLGKRFATMAEFRAALEGCRVWAGVNPEMAREFLPRPSSLEGMEDLLPADFMEGLSHEAPPGRRSRRHSQAVAMPARLSVALLDPRSSGPDAPADVATRGAANAVPLLDDEHTPTRPIPPAAKAVPTPDGPAPSGVSRRRQRLTFDAPVPPAPTRFRTLGLSLALLCGLAAVASVTSLASRPAAAWRDPRASIPAEKLPREIPEVREAGRVRRARRDGP